MTSDLVGRITEHKSRTDPGSITARYNLDKRVHFEDFQYIEEAIAREKQLKGGSRAKKVALIEAMDPRRKDLYEELLKD